MPFRGVGSEQSKTEGGGLMGHSVARVQKVQRVQRGRLTAFQAEGCGIALTGNAYKVSVTGIDFLCHMA